MDRFFVKFWQGYGLELLHLLELVVGLPLIIAMCLIIVSFMNWDEITIATVLQLDCQAVWLLSLLLAPIIYFFKLLRSYIY